MRGLVLALAAVLGGCATSGPSVHEARRLELDRSTCVSEISALDSVAIPRKLGEKKQKLPLFKFENLARCLLAADGTAVPVAVFQTDGKLPSEIHISLFVGASTAFAAAVDLLDQERRLVRTVPFSQFTRRGSSYTGSIFMNAADSDIRYLVFRPDADSVGGAHSSTAGIRSQVPYVIPIPGGVIYGSVATGSERVMQTWLSEVGTFSIHAEDYAPEVLGG